MSKPTCDTCKYHTKGVIHNYPWQDCSKNWSEKGKPLIGVLKHICSNYKVKENACSLDM